MAIKVDPETNIPTRSSQAAEWINWHKELRAYFGKTAANALFLKAWNLRGGKSSDANTDDLRAYLRDNGIEIDKSLTASVVDTAEGAFDKISGIFHIGQTTALVVGAAILIPVVILLINVARRPEVVVGAAARGLSPIKV